MVPCVKRSQTCSFQQNQPFNCNTKRSTTADRGPNVSFAFNCKVTINWFPIKASRFLHSDWKQSCEIKQSRLFWFLLFIRNWSCLVLAIGQKHCHRNKMRIRCSAPERGCRTHIACVDGTLVNPREAFWTWMNTLNTSIGCGQRQ